MNVSNFFLSLEVVLLIHIVIAAGLRKHSQTFTKIFMAYGDTREAKWKEKYRKQRVASTLYTTSEHGLSNITTVDAHTSAASYRMNWRPAHRPI